jgi:hypothetical protein
MPTGATTIQLYPAKQSAKNGHATVTVSNRGTKPLVLSTRTVLLHAGCKTSSLTGVKVPETIRLAADQTKTVHVNVSHTQGDVGVVFTPSESGSGITESGSIGAQILTTSTAESCVPPHLAATGSTSSGLPVIPILLLAAVFIALCAAVALTVGKRPKAQHRAH